MTNTRKSFGASFPLEERSWFEIYQILSAQKQNHVLLESGRGGRYSFLGLTPFAEIRGKSQQMSIKERGQTQVVHGPVLDSLRTWLRRYEAEKDEALPDFQGGLIGQLSYDLIREFESLPVSTADDLQTDDVFLLAFDEFYVIDHALQRRWNIVIAKGEEEAAVRLEQLDQDWNETAEQRVPPFPTPDAADTAEELHRSFSEADFAKAVNQTKQYIRQGDVFQVNLSVRETRPQTSAPLHVYKHLRQLNPSPYMAFMHTPDLQYISASPELLVKVKGEEVSTRPIAGTRSRGKDDKEDRELAETLLANEKERAEHIMLVDLERNDLGRVCEYGTVTVDELMVIEKYSHVQHIVSNIKGRKAPRFDALDVIQASFPGGTITGAPKIRTMEIIEELEPVRRGAYTGAMGWIGFNGDMELNITIRTMIAKGGLVHVQAGAGIVIDSEPRAEYRESLKKAKALWKAKELSETETAEQRRILK